MNKILKSILDRSYKHCFYRSGIFISNIAQLIDNAYTVSETYNDGKKAEVMIGDICKINLQLTDTSYIRDINVEELR